MHWKTAAITASTFDKVLAMTQQGHKQLYFLKEFCIMNKQNDPYNQKINEMSSQHRNQIEMMYRGYGKHYTDIVRSMSDKIFNGAFTLNTGGLAVTITFMGAAIKWHSFAFKDLFPFLIMIIIYGLGIVSIVIVAIFEHIRFNKKGTILDSFFCEFNEKKITANEFMEKLPPKIFYLDWIVSKLEKSSYWLFSVGLTIAVAFLICKSSV